MARILDRADASMTGDGERNFEVRSPEFTSTILEDELALSLMQSSKYENSEKT